MALNGQDSAMLIPGNRVITNVLPLRLKVRSENMIAEERGECIAITSL